MNKPVIFVVLLVVLGGAAGGFFYWKFVTEQHRPAPISIPPDKPAVPEYDEPPRIIHPIPDDPTAPPDTQPPEAQDTVVEPKIQPEPAPPLPSLDDSDPPLLAALSGLFDRNTLETLFNLEGIIRRFVVTIDNLPGGKLSMRHVITRATAGRFLVIGDDDNRLLDPANFSRYTPFVRVAEALDSEQMVSLYVYYYPLFQQAYEDLGYPSAYFNDRLVEVIDHLLDTPEVRGPIRLQRPRVFYTFADADLEALSAGQKALIRAGPDNATRLKTKLREVRRILASDAS